MSPSLHYGSFIKEETHFRAYWRFSKITPLFVQKNQTCDQFFCNIEVPKIFIAMKSFKWTEIFMSLGSSLNSDSGDKAAIKQSN